MRIVPVCSMLTAVAVAGCGPSPVEVTTQLVAAVNNKTVDTAMALVAPEAAAQVRPLVDDLVAKNTRLELSGQYRIEADKVFAVEKLTDDATAKLGVAPVEADLEAQVKRGKLTFLAVTLTPESQAKIDAATALAVRKVVDDFETAVNTKSLDAALALVAEDVVHTCLDKTLRGKAEVKAHLEQAFVQGLGFEKTERTVKGSNVAWNAKVATDEWRKANVAPLDASGEALVENGLLKSFTLTLTPEAATKLQGLTATAAAAGAKKAGK